MAYTHSCICTYWTHGDCMAFFYLLYLDQVDTVPAQVAHIPALALALTYSTSDSIRASVYIDR